MKNKWRFSGNELDYLKEVVASGFGSGTSGSMNNRFEKAFAEKVGVKYAITFNSGTSTLHAALHAADVHAGDEVIVPPLTVISNVDVIFAQNAIPVFVDVDRDTFNIDPAKIEEKITDRTKVIMPVSLYGLSCDLEAINRIAEKHNLVVVNDAAEAFGAEYNGRDISSQTDITSYSLENSKHLTTGDGGIVVTDNEKYAVSMRKYGSLGYAAMKSGDGRIRINKDIFQDPDYKRHDEIGLNYRMPEVAAALGLAQTERMEHFIGLRLKSAQMYQEAVQGCSYIVPQQTPSGYRNTYWTFTVRYVHPDVSWQQFRHKYMEFGGDGIYAAWALSYAEPLLAERKYVKRAPFYFENVSYPSGICPVAEEIQPQLMQFVTNYGSETEMEQMATALGRTIRYFE